MISTDPIHVVTVFSFFLFLERQWTSADKCPSNISLFKSRPNAEIQALWRKKKNSSQNSHWISMGLYQALQLLLDEIFVISGIIKVKVSVAKQSQRLRLITLTRTLFILAVTVVGSNNYLVILCFKENDGKCSVTWNTLHCVQNLMPLTTCELDNGNHALCTWSKDYPLPARQVD